LITHVLITTLSSEGWRRPSVTHKQMIDLRAYTSILALLLIFPCDIRKTW
jgi:hypothetical protein